MMRWMRALWWRIVEPPGDPDPDELVVVESTTSEATAGMWRGMLESAGVPCVVKGTLRYGFFVPTPLRLYVRYGDLEHARAVLAEVDAVPAG